MNEQRLLRQNSIYLRDTYKWMNYDDYLLVEFENDVLKLNILGQGINEDVLRERLGYEATFFQKRRFSSLALRKVIDAGVLTYQCGTLCFNGSFYPHPLDLGYFLIRSITEDISQHGNNQPNVEINLTFYLSKNIGPFSTPMIHSKDSESLISSEKWHEEYTFDLSYKIHVIGRINRISNSINHIISYLTLGLDPKKLKKILPAHDCPKDSDIIPEKVFEFCKNLKFKEWSQTFNRVGKDNRMESGNIIENLGHDPYLRKLSSGYRDYKLSADGVLRRDDPTDYGYVPSTPYQESELPNSEPFRQGIFIYLLRNYNASDDFIYSLQEISI